MEMRGRTKMDTKDIVKQVQARMQDKLDAVSAALDDFRDALSDAEDCLYELVDLIQQYEEYEVKENR